LLGLLVTFGQDVQFLSRGDLTNYIIVPDYLRYRQFDLDIMFSDLL